MRMIAVLVALTLAAGPAAAEKLSLQAISDYLNSLQSSKSAFRQINSDGSVSTGELAIKRPGRARFDYNPPAQALVVVGGGRVAIFDRKTGQAPEQYSIRRTPLKVILQENVDLTRSGMVVRHEYNGSTTTITAMDPANPEYGTIDLVFSDGPVALKQWVLRDQGGGETTVILGELDKQARLPSALFNIQNEISKLGN